MVIHLAEVEKQDGIIIVLDQEKAYDKIEHDYLWQTLQTYRFPPNLISTIQSLYQDAHTCVAINGKLSTPFQVTREVRQGDPLSCLLFDLAIESLASMLQHSELIGSRIVGKKERLIATLFADDTTTYLSKHDDFSKLTDILQNWCIPSGAKFNVNKTEIIPIGSPAHREAVYQTRYLNGTNGTPVPNDIKITRDGEAIRSLGAWIGNNIYQADVWSRILNKIDSSLERWEKGKPTIEGRHLIVLMVVGGMTQYLAKVQGIPPEIERRIDRRT